MNANWLGPLRLLTPVSPKCRRNRASAPSNAQNKAFITFLNRFSPKRNWKSPSSQEHAARNFPQANLMPSTIGAKYSGHVLAMQIILNNLSIDLRSRALPKSIASIRKNSKKNRKTIPTEYCSARKESFLKFCKKKSTSATPC